MGQQSERSLACTMQERVARRPAMHWIDPLFVILGVVAVGLAIWVGAGAPDLFQHKRRRIICPITGHRVDCVFVENSLTDEPIAVDSCSAFVRQPPACQKDCLRRPVAAARKQFVI
jgi:hypothetical protein